MPAKLVKVKRSYLKVDHDFLDRDGDGRPWARWLKKVEKVLGLEMDRLDHRDPLRRKVQPRSWDEQGEFIVSFRARQSSRWVFGRFADTRIRFRINLHRDRPNLWNRISWTIDPEAVSRDELAGVLEQLFDAGNLIFRPFYAVADSEKHLATKAKAGGFGVDYQAELSGVFWLTYFNKQYCEFFGRDKFAAIKEAEIDSKGGARLRLGVSPFTYREARRTQIERKLGSASFIDPKSRREKKHGESVLTFEQLRRKVRLRTPKPSD